MALSVERIFLHRYTVILILAVILLLLIPLSASVGLRRVSFLDVYRVLIGCRLPEEDFIALWLRLRRALVGAAVGAILGGAGVIAQSVFRNPLASPFTLGISQAAALGVAIALLLGYGGTASQWFISIARPYVLPMAAFSLAFVQTVIVLLLAYKAGLSPQALVLSSIAMSFLYQAILALLQYLVMNELQIATIVFWAFGDLGRAGNIELLVLAVSLPVIASLYLLLHLDLDLLSIGDDIAYSSGVNPKRLRLVAMMIAAVGTAVATSFVGVLAFLCLLAPHIARALVESPHRYLIPASMLIGSALLISADIIARIALHPRTLPVGVVLSFLGVPLAISMLLKGPR